MDLAFKITILAFAACGAWTVSLTALHTAQALWPKIVGWFTRERAMGAADLAAFEARLDARFKALESRIGITAGA